MANPSRSNKMVNATIAEDAHKCGIVEDLNGNGDPKPSRISTTSDRNALPAKRANFSPVDVKAITTAAEAANPAVNTQNQSFRSYLCM
jgi:hypothetical protein